MDKKFQGYLLVSDMDGTLIDNDGKISEKNIKAINSFVERGGIFTLATGRMVESARRYLHLININIPVILYNGTKIYDYNKEETIYELFLEDKIKSIIKQIKQYDASLGIEIYCEENVCIFNHCRFTKRFDAKRPDVYYDIPERLWNTNWTKVLILGEEEQIDKLEEDFISIFGQVNLVRSGENFLEILPQNTSKGHALHRLCEMINIDISNTISVGDNMNDYEMLKKSGYGFCVANANKKLLNEIKYKCSSNDKHAIEYVVKWAEENLN
ncbi:HAD family hydrolase [Clostridium sp. DJ247]|uniref:HAD family hydrolase n=1 Tax=Clostridium sp. DJ247 TaxID=2726188 RepID=UPI00162A7E88|nr:HAD family hydrolase [Clostridium sp. DJ247]MBC2578812.1 HAD family hydrolase [Clostridium sp. DJ247]